MMTLAKTKYVVLISLFFWLAPLFAQAEGLIADQHFKGKHEIVVSFSGPVDKVAAENINNYTVFEEPDPDIGCHLVQSPWSEDHKSVILRFKVTA